MQKLFENWRIYIREATIGGETLPSGKTIGPQSIDEPGTRLPNKEPENREIKIKPLVRVLDSFSVGPVQYTKIMTKFDKIKKSPKEYIEDFNSGNYDKEYIRDIVQKLLGSRDIGIDRDRITFSV